MKDRKPKAEPAAEAKSAPDSFMEYRPWKEFTYKSTPQGELRMRVCFSFDCVPGDRRPGIVFFYGGGWSGFRPHQFNRQAAYLAARGMVAACAEYRCKSIHGTSPLECVEDAKSAVRWMRSRAADLGVDPGRVVAAGGSSGAHLAACTALCEGFEADGEDLPISSAGDALVLFNPPLTVNAERQKRFGIPAEAAEAISPTRHLTRHAPPTLLLYGSADRLYADGQEFLARSRQLGSRVEMYLADGEGHGFFNFSPWFERTLHRTDEFLASLGYLAGPPTFTPPR